jgi:hypothetical protein
LKDEQTTKDIIKNILHNHKINAIDYDKISSYFWQGNLIDTCKYIFDFLKKNVKYCIEPDNYQTVKSPGAIISTGIYKNGYNDCKHYSSFIGGILDSLNRKGKKIDWAYRFANYKLFANDPGHVFIVVFNNGKEIWIDPVLQFFNQRHPYISAIDKKINSMSLYSISGIDDNGQISGRGLAKIALAPSRNAYLVLVGLNFHKMATHLYQTIQDPKRMAALKAKWEKKGGNFKKLLNTIYKGSKHKELITKRVKKGRRRRMGEPEGIGSVAAIVTLMGAAVPVLTALKEFLPKNSKALEEADKAIKEISAAGGLNMPGVQIPNEEGTIPRPTPNTIPQDDTSTGGSDIKQYLPYAAVGVAAIFLLTSRSK